MDSGELVGKHKGFHYWTVGQNVKLGGYPIAYFIYKKDIQSNNIIVVCTKQILYIYILYIIIYNNIYMFIYINMYQ